jgi:signal-transduction protein with cAMP-binding, CBS, and nucleotidyltransferase domain
LAKFFAGIITIGGGCSLGREGPTVHIAGALASNIAGMLGVAKQGRRAGYYRVPQQDWRQHSIHLCRRMLNRNALLEGQNIEQAQRPAEVVNPDATIRDAVAKMIDKSVSLLVVISPTDETPIGIVTLHDIFRLQNQLAEAM